MQQEIFKNGCGGCLKAQQDPREKYVCPNLSQHLADQEQQERSNYY